MSKKLWFGIIVVALALATLYVWTAIAQLEGGGR